VDPLGILADDLTGACDCVAPFAARGARTAVQVRPGGALPAPGDWDVLAVNTDSRNVPEAEARSRVRSAALALRQAGWPLGFKKVDSTLRGHLSAELEELLALGVPRAWIAPAFPLNGRTVVDGILYVNGVPLGSTELSADGLAPIAAGKIAAALAAACEPIGHLPAALYAQGAAAVAGQVRFDRARGCRATVCDATEQAHLALLARILKAPEIAAPRELWVGSAGLARELAHVLLPGGDPGGKGGGPEPAPSVAPMGPVLVIAGSRQQVTRAQADALAKQPGVTRIALDPARAGAGPDRVRALAEAMARLNPGRGAGACVFLVTVESGAAATAGESSQLAVRARDVRATLGRLAADAVAALAPCGLVLTGGDVALAALDALAVDRLAVDGELAPGIARTHVAEGVHRGLPVVTKAGGFGNDETLVAVSRALGAWHPLRALRGATP